MNPILIDAVGVAAALCSMGSFVPQALKIMRDHEADAVSAPMYVVTVAGFALWTGYGVLIGQWPLIVANAISGALAASVLALKIRFSFAGAGSAARRTPQRSGRRAAS